MESSIARSISSSRIPSSSSFGARKTVADPRALKPQRLLSLTRHGHDVRLPQDDRVYLAFRIALKETLAEIEFCLALHEEPGPPMGFLCEVVFLEPVPLTVQADLLAETWARHYKPDLIEATLLDAAVIYAACYSAGDVFEGSPDVAKKWLRGGPRKIPSGLRTHAVARLAEVFDRFWDDRSFLLVAETQDLPPEDARFLKAQLGLDDEVLEPLYQALQRGRVSPAVASNLAGLMTEPEIEEAMPLLRADLSRPR